MNTAARVGRPPGPHDDTLARLLPAARRLLVDEGAASLTPTRLHRETGIARATIYRNWPDPAELIEILVADAVEPPPADLVRGDVRRDLLAAMEVVGHALDEGPTLSLLAACAEHGRRSERVATAAESFVAGLVAPVRTVVRAGLEAGALTGQLDALVSELTGGMLVERGLLGRRVPRSRTRAVVDHVLDHHLVGDPDLGDSVQRAGSPG